MSQETRPNIIVVMTDTLRTAYLGCYGNEAIRTPKIDAFAEQSVKFTRAYPESLPTIPVRRAIHTGRRAFPFRDYAPVPWDIVYLPGWQPLGRGEDCLAERLADAGYHTGFVTDTLPCFAPGFNFQRGFWQWEYIRGMQQDRWRSVNTVIGKQMADYLEYISPEGRVPPPQLYAHVPYHIANTADRLHEQDFCTARTFQWAMDFLEDNRNAGPFYLYVDSFAPHEPWEAPPMYYERYADGTYDGPTVLHVRYTTRQEQGLDEAATANIIAHYSGLVSLTDAWFGMLLDKLDRLGLADNTMVVFTSDHGTNFGDNPFDIIGKPAHSLWPGVMHLPLLVRMPGQLGAGKVVDELVYNLDISATVCDLAGIGAGQGLDGQSLLPLSGGEGEWQPRQYVTSRYNNALCYIDDEVWIRTDTDRELGEAFAVKSDPLCQKDISDELDEAVFAAAWERILADAGGELPVYDMERLTDAVGQSPERRK